MADENEPAPEGASSENDAREPKDQRIPIMMSVSELKAIDDWSFANRIRSRAEAIRRLCQTGLAASESLDRLFPDILAMNKAFAIVGNMLNDVQQQLNDEKDSIEFNFSEFYKAFSDAMGKRNEVYISLFDLAYIRNLNKSEAVPFFSDLNFVKKFVENVRVDLKHVDESFYFQRKKPPSSESE